MSRPPVPLLIATLPARTPEEAIRQIAAAREAGADAAEIRFDRWGAEARARQHELFPSALPLVATLRSHAEGGEGPDEPEARGAWVRRALSAPFSFIDLEAGRDAVPPARDRARVRVILSTHLPPGTDPRAVGPLIAAKSPSRSIRKVVIPAGVGDVIAKILPDLSGAPRDFIVHTTGPSGPLLRAWARRLRMSGAYTALPRRAAGGAGPVESSQLPVDRLRRYFDARAPAPLFAVAGRPVGHSRSPDIHHLWMHRRGLVGLYLPLEFGSEGELADSLPALARGGFRGLNITHPFKATAFSLATAPTAAALRCGGANTLTLDGSSVHADNTDLFAMKRRLDELARAGEWAGRGALVVGAGGAARSALAALEDRGAAAWVLARDPERMGAAAAEYGATPATGPPGSDADLIIHATTVGRSGGPIEVEIAPWLRPGIRLLDYVYAPSDDRLAQATRRAGGHYEDGARLLAYSAAESFRQWWGEAPSEADLSAALEEIAS